MEIVYSHGKIKEFIDSLEPMIARRTYRLVSHLEQTGYGIRMPHSKIIGNGLFELRLQGSVHVRIIYAFHVDAAVLLNIFIKKTWLIPCREIEYAQDILIKYLA